MDTWTPWWGFVAGLVISLVTSPVGVSGAVFLLPVQLSVLGVPSPSVTPTNLLFNVVAVPGALARYRRAGTLRGRLTRLLLLGAVPGVVVGAVLRVVAVPGPDVFRVIVAALLLPLGSWLVVRAVREPPRRDTTAPTPDGALGDRAVVALSLGVGVVGGVYGIGGGSILAPVLAGRGLSVARVAPAALACTFVTSVVGAATYGLLSLAAGGEVRPDWAVGLACGAGGLVGGYLGARLQPRVPERALRLVLGGLAVGLAVAYITQVAT